jgi:rhodanese-related sulfurtransferase
MKMDIKRFFKSVPEMSVREVRQFLKDKNPEDYNLVDVRQPKEFEGGHLPGAKLIPVGELQDRLKEIDPHKPTIAY